MRGGPVLDSLYVAQFPRHLCSFVVVVAKSFAVFVIWGSVAVLCLGGFRLDGGQ